jgi:DMSO/TMAO reductase YedYZ molybdopterin-dependent catalytic subunit
MATYTEEEEELGQQEWDGRTHKGAAFLAGALAGMAMTIAMLLLLLLGITPRSVSNLVADKIAATAGPGITEFFIQTIGALGKEMLFFTVLLGQVVVGGLLGLLLVSMTGRTKNRQIVWRNSFIISTGFWLLFIVAGLPLLDLGFLGVGLETDQISTLVISFLLFQLFGLMLGYAYFQVMPTGYTEPTTSSVLTPAQIAASKARFELEAQTSRRRFVGTVSAIFVVMVGAAIGTKAFGGVPLTDYRASLGDLKPDGSLEGEITPTGSFYQVSKNAFNPNVDGNTWKLEVNGLVNQPLNFDLNSISQLPRQKVYHTLTCISNPVGGDLIGNAEWSGVPLKTILNQAGVKPGVKKVVFTSADGYKDSISIEKALEPNTTLAVEMNGAPLTSDHGYPARMLIPDIYGMKNAKWLTAISLIDTDFAGFWQKQGWDNLATIRTESSIVFPPDDSAIKAGEPIVIKGTAYAGSRNIEKVEVSTDNGQTWLPATLKDRLGPNSWTLWRLEWTPPAGSSKTYILKVRATEQGGKVQEAQQADPYPSGSAGYHTISVQTL